MAGSNQLDALTLYPQQNCLLSTIKSRPTEPKLRSELYEKRSISCCRIESDPDASII